MQFKDGKYPESMLQFFILKVWQRLLGRDDIGIDDDFVTVGGDSDLAKKMMSTIQIAIGQKIYFQLTEGTTTIRAVEASIVRQSQPPSKLLVRQKEGEGGPLLFCHGDYAMRGLYASKIVETLIFDGAVYLVHPHPNPKPEMTIEDMAEAHIPEILTRHPDGPFRLIGYCNGGQLAWQIAHRLEELDRRVELVVLVETISLNARRYMRVLSWLIRIIRSTGPRALREKAWLEWMDFAWKRTCRLSTPSPYMPASTPYSTALRNYIPPKLNARIVCILSDDSRNRVGLSPLYWNSLAPVVECLYVPGNHLNDLSTLVGELTPLLNELL
jgi:pimeloyl-ACP methyl ester carboxylesterase